ncbi:MAG: PHP domain-containing protein [Victivallales bacterium]|nr:PHP domain-containing protein [Victivallales bacterium]
MTYTIDTHIHTHALSDCCEDPLMTIENIARLLASRGFRAMAVTDHVWDNPAIPCNEFYRLHPARGVLKQCAEIHSGKYPLKVLAGCEADMRAPGEFGITPALKEKLDLVILSTNHFHMREFVEQPRPATPANLGKSMAAFFRSGVCSGLADILAHPLFPIGYEELFDQTIATFSDEELVALCGEAAIRKIALEINAGVLHSIEKHGCSQESYLRIFTLARQIGCRFTFGSDAHCLADFDEIQRCETFAKQAGITPSLLIDIPPMKHGCFMGAVDDGEAAVGTSN